MFCSMFQLKFSNFFAQSGIQESAAREKKKLDELEDGLTDESASKFLKKE